MGPRSFAWGDCLLYGGQCIEDKTARVIAGQNRLLEDDGGDDYKIGNITISSSWLRTNIVDKSVCKRVGMNRKARRR